MTATLATITYVYAVTTSEPDSGQGHTPPSGGIDGASVRALPVGPLTAVVSSLPRDHFSEAALKDSLNDLGRLEAVARGHHTVVSDMAAHRPVLPLRLATIYDDDERVRQMVRGRAREFLSALDRFAGRAEWGVKVFTDDTPAPADEGDRAAPAPSRPTTPGGGGAGRAYLRRRIQRREARERAWERASDLSTRLVDRLDQLAEARRRHRAQDNQLSGARGGNVLNAAFLVSEENTRAFAAEVERWSRAEPGVRVELTGPWVPYSFVPDGLDERTSPDPSPSTVER
ncbi:GvpL/GvpF family gas vesicle protein [Actinoalloteichus caeruleus]|uniref:Gas vesicle synthesis protein GvpL/GvpF n=1 Tax=Actinoalloteichus caeruleus DSM 43889 TaxID=1120930 RepID=A0ABT1JI35_ACTCY|nr:GvpL/GvpF family gas vesicle protein [Actinoalloteichus caeruleus]MCP2332183.1 Gas vesicle synthesis protein GvpL/GvpF [Actinoalloteichus caeruleus DSM 43889]